MRTTIVMKAILALSLTGCATKGQTESREAVGVRVERPTPSPTPSDPEDYLRWSATESITSTSPHFRGPQWFEIMHERIPFPGVLFVEGGLVTVPATIGLLPPIYRADSPVVAHMAQRLLFLPEGRDELGTTLLATLSVELPVYTGPDVAVYIPVFMFVQDPATSGILIY